MRSLPSILHVDLDAFYASVEQLHKPSLRGKPVIVGGVGVRGVVSTASYEARAFGVHSALATGIARRRAPNAAYLIPRFGAYQAYSETVMALMHELSPLVEPLSLDEAFLDIAHLFSSAHGTGPRAGAARAREIAGDLRDRIRAATGLTASVGAASSKLVAKIASDAEKPGGLVVVTPGTEQEWLDPLPVRALWGVGPATAERLRKIGATTVAELRTLSRAELVAELGTSSGGGLYAIARGLDDRDVSPDRELKSVSVEDTFAEDLLDPATIGAQMDRLVSRLGTRLRSAGRSGRTISIKVRGHDFTTVSRSETAVGPTDDPAVIRAAAHRMLPGAVAAATAAVPGIRLLGVGVSALAEWAQLDLFAEIEAEEELLDEDDLEPRLDDPTDPADMTTPVVTVEGERSPRQFGPLPPGTRGAVSAARAERRFLPGQDVTHDEFGGGWVQGAGLGRVTVRFETPWSEPGRIKTLRADDEALHLVDSAAVAREALTRLPVLVGRGPEPGVSIGPMTEEPTKTEVVDNELENRFEIWYGDSLAGFAAYRRRAGATVFVHTEIGDEFGGKGLGSVLARRALEATVERGETIVPVCPFIAAYLRKHPEFEGQVRWPESEAASDVDSSNH
ncbi:MAG: DNA polymerase IV [Catenulisporales bacterium]|nr:DNA polymerase IV [Catenulisporales bacterium]